ncbi:MAG: biopolymer transporter ExbD [Shewanella sp.]|nr:biopolymer transporter ExbD [Shewanella sp.]MCF1431281.1 biopolymer transporter ExbD [Shewanella sp.]MCF1438603.1 biopolymer transporter ExbD [Shewanella sp.]MCF1457891.1 biopolymer transporter ExbD [Shewanella sp.]
MIHPPQAEQELDVGVDMTALIDIIFIMLVFFMLTANVRLQALPVDVPTQGDESTQMITETDSISINVMADSPYWALDGERLDDFNLFEQQLLERLKTHPKAPLIVAADKHADVQHLMRLLALLQAQSISQTQILMEP